MKGKIIVLKPPMCKLLYIYHFIKCSERARKIYRIIWQVKNWDSERSRKLSQITQIISCRSSFKSRLWFQTSQSSPLITAGFCLILISLDISIIQESKIHSGNHHSINKCWHFFLRKENFRCSWNPLFIPPLFYSCCFVHTIGNTYPELVCLLSIQCFILLLDMFTL